MKLFINVYFNDQQLVGWRRVEKEPNKLVRLGFPMFIYLNIQYKSKSKFIHFFLLERCWRESHIGLETKRTDQWDYFALVLQQNFMEAVFISVIFPAQSGWVWAYSGRGEPTTYTSCRGGERHVVLLATRAAWLPLLSQLGLRRASLRNESKANLFSPSV